MSEPPLIQLQGITKRFPGALAVDGVSLLIRRGACHALVGENGAGKSTLGRMLAGIHAPDSGEIFMAGDPVRFASPREAMQAGIGLVHQELALCENLSVAENISLGALPRFGPFLSWRRMEYQARERLQAIQAAVNPAARVGDLPVSQQQMVQIATAVGRGARVLIFDEPTSSLSQVEAEHLFNLIRRLHAQGITSIYISHRLEEVFRLCDTVTVLRDGRAVATKPIADVDRDSLVQMMIGRTLAAYFPRHLDAPPGQELLRVESLSSPGKFHDISFTLRAGEILGLAGLVGAGRTEIAQALFGLDPRARGRVAVQGRTGILRRPAAAMKLGLGLVPEDRKRHGLVLSMAARENVTLPILEKMSRLGWVRAAAERALAAEYFASLDIRAAGLDALTATLSGGNQQKLVLAKWLAARCRVLLVDEPTRGVDVGAKAEIHGLLDRLAHEGAGLLLISSELPELINLSTRVIVLRAGRIVGELPRGQATPEAVLRLMAGMSPRVSPEPSGSARPDSI